MKRTVDNATISVLQWQNCANSAVLTTLEKLTQGSDSYETQKPNTQNLKNNVCARSKLKSVECLSTAHSLNINAILDVQLCKHTKQIANTQHDLWIQTHLKASKQSMFSALLVCTVAHSHAMGVHLLLLGSSGGGGGASPLWGKSTGKHLVYSFEL